LKEKVAPFLTQAQGFELAVALVADLMAAGCTSLSDFRQIEAGVHILSNMQNRNVLVRMIKAFLGNHKRKLEVEYKTPKAAVTITREVVFDD